MKKVRRKKKFDITKMKIFIPSKGRAETISTHKLFEGTEIPYYVVVHSEEEKKEYHRKAKIPSKNILVSGAVGITGQRQWIMDQTKKGEWFLSLDDKIKNVRVYSPKFYNEEVLDFSLVLRYGNRDRKNGPFMIPVVGHEILKICEETVKKAQETGAALAGFAVIDNPAYRLRKWREVGHISNAMVLMKNVGIDWDPNLETMEEVGNFAEHMLRRGKVLINAYVWPEKKHYEKGGIGTFNQRFPLKILECVYLQWKYGGLLKLRSPKNRAENSEIRIVLRNLKQVEKWRNYNGYH